jgi:hypothetical protein
MRDQKILEEAKINSIIYQYTLKVPKVHLSALCKKHYIKRKQLHELQS